MASSNLRLVALMDDIDVSEPLEWKVDLLLDAEDMV
jgi:hypothetical protein